MLTASVNKFLLSHKLKLALAPRAVLAVMVLWCADPKPSPAQVEQTVKQVEQTVKAAPRNIKARDFTNTFGVNIHFGQNNYKNTQAIADALNIIGFSRVRSSCVSADEVAAWKDLTLKSAPYFPEGLKADVLINGYLNAPDVTLASQQVLVPQIADTIESIEGPNEINNYFVGQGTHGPQDKIDQTTSFALNSQAWAKALYLWRQKTPSLSKARLLAPSIASGDPQDYAKLPDVSAYVDAGNFHFYAGNGREPSNFGGGNFAAIHNWYRSAAAPNKRPALTEWGQTTASKPGQGGCDAATQAKYVLNQMFDAASMGVYRAYLYQLMDGTANGGPTGQGGTESHFGLFDYKWRVKPAAQALANLKNLLADTTTDFKSAIPAYSVLGIENTGAAGSSLSISKSDGSTFLVVWNEPQIWDPKTNTPVASPANRVTLIFGGDYSYKVYNPLQGIEARAAGRGSQVQVDVAGSPILVQIRQEVQR